MAIVHNFQPKNSREALFASITDLRKAPKWIISEGNIFFAFHKLIIPMGYWKIHVNKNWDANIPHTVGKVRAGLLFSVADWRKAE